MSNTRRPLDVVPQVPDLAAINAQEKAMSEQRRILSIQLAAQASQPGDGSELITRARAIEEYLKGNSVVGSAQ